MTGWLRSMTCLLVGLAGLLLIKLAILIDGPTAEAAYKRVAQAVEDGATKGAKNG